MICFMFCFFIQAFYNGIDCTCLNRWTNQTLHVVDSGETIPKPESIQERCDWLATHTLTFMTIKIFHHLCSYMSHCTRQTKPSSLEMTGVAWLAFNQTFHSINLWPGPEHNSIEGLATAKHPTMYIIVE